MLRQNVAKALRRRGIQAFLKQLPPSPTILDVGCGNNSPRRIKSLVPKSHYVGIDVTDYNQSTGSLEIADEYIVCDPEAFTAAVDSLGERFDGIISSHNIEHCDDRVGTIRAMAKSLKPAGLMFLSFPCAQSVRFSSREGTLNYFDDPTHQFEPPDLDEVLGILRSESIEIVYCSERYRPVLLLSIGLLLEPLSALLNRVLPGTWALHGFETIIWAKKQAGS